MVVYVCSSDYPLNTTCVKHFNTERSTDVHTDSPADMGEAGVSTQHHPEGLIYMYNVLFAQVHIEYTHPHIHSEISSNAQR